MSNLRALLQQEYLRAQDRLREKHGYNRAHAERFLGEALCACVEAERAGRTYQPTAFVLSFLVRTGAKGGQ